MRKLVSLICILIGIFSSLLLTSCNIGGSYISAEEYELEDRYEIFDGIKYNYSTLGLIATEVLEAKEELTIQSRLDNQEVYAVAPNFLQDNNTVKILNLPNSNIIYQSNSISNCPNLTEINLKNYGKDQSIEINPLCERNAFNLADDCYFYVYDIMYLEHYVYGFQPYVTKFKLLDKVSLWCRTSGYVTDFSDYSIKESSSSFSVKGIIFGLIDIDISDSRDSNSCSKIITLIDDPDFFIKNGNKIKKTELEISLNMYLCPRKTTLWGAVAKDYPVSVSGTKKYDNLLNSIGFVKAGKPGINASLKVDITYDF